MTNLRLKVIELVGLNLGNNGRTCGIHPFCGQSVEITDQLKLRATFRTVTEEVQVQEEVLPPPIPEGAFIAKKRGRPKAAKFTTVLRSVTKTEAVFEARKWINGVESCLIGYVSKPFISIGRKSC
jgi:hypothetical protein